MIPNIFTAESLKSISPSKNIKRYIGIEVDRGISLSVRPSGKKTWYFSYVFEKIKYEIELGEYDDYTLKEIHSIVKEHRIEISEGINPNSINTDTSHNYTLATVRDLLDAYYITLNRNNKKSFRNIQTIIERHIGSLVLKFAHDVKPSHIQNICQKIEKPSSRDKFHSYLRAAFNCAIHWNDYDILNKPHYNFEIKTNPVPTVHSLFSNGYRPVERDRVLSFDEIHRLVNSTIINRTSKIKIKLVIALGQRLEQILTAPINEIDFDNQKWTWGYNKETQRHRMKTKLNHSIPLTDFQIELIKEAYALRGSQGKFLFPNTQDHSKPIQPSLREPINNYISKTNCKPFQARDFRRTFRIMGRTLGIPKAHLDAIQHHRIYDDGSEEINHWRDKQEAMKIWSDKLKDIY